MDNFYLSAVTQEATLPVVGRTVVKVSLVDSSVLIDLHLAGDRQLLASLDRNNPAFYLSTKTAQFLTGTPGSPLFLSLLRKHVVGARLVKLWKPPLDRIVHIDFEKLDASDTKVPTALVLTLTGRSANARLINAQGTVLGALFERGEAQPGAVPMTPFNPEELTRGLDDSIKEPEILDRFFGADSIFGPQLRNEFVARCHDRSPAAAFGLLIEDLFVREPVPLVYSRWPFEQIKQQVINPKTDLLLSHIELVGARGMQRYQFPSLSEAAENYYDARERATALSAEYAALKRMLAREIKRRQAAIKAIESDRARFEQPEKLKRFGDLILANLTSARKVGSKVIVVDYYDPNQREIQIDISEGATLQEGASDYFARYRKARRALAAIASREREVSRNLDPLKQLSVRLEQEPTSRCIAEVGKAAEQLLGARADARDDADKHGRGKGRNAFGRKFKSSDGYEIVVGRNDRDNDTLTFRVARPNDIWLHAADYPGSHVIIRNPTRESAPRRAIIEAAELAAFYSQAKREGKAAVHYTQKKFVSKPPRSKPGLVRLSSFKTVLVEPRCNLERLN